jgi:GTPase SAR1 family protein
MPFFQTMSSISIISPPHKVIERGVEAVIQYLNSANEKLKTMGVFIVGCASAGKSTLREILLISDLNFEGNNNNGDEEIAKVYSKEREATHSIQLFRTSQNEHGILQIYDFAGQTEYYANHELFFKPLSSCYLIVISLFTSDNHLKSFAQIEKELRDWYNGLENVLAGEILHQPNRLMICFSHYDKESKLTRNQRKLFKERIQQIYHDLKAKTGVPDHSQIFFLGHGRVNEVKSLKRTLLESIITINNGSPIYIPPTYQNIISYIPNIHSDPHNPKSIISFSDLRDSLNKHLGDQAVNNQDLWGALEILENIGDIYTIRVNKHYPNNDNEGDDDDNNGDGGGDDDNGFDDGDDVHDDDDDGNGDDDDVHDVHDDFR